MTEHTAEHGYDDPRITAMGLFTEAFTGLTGHLATQIAEHGLSLAEFEVLIRLARSPPRCPPIPSATA